VRQIVNQGILKGRYISLDDELEVARADPARWLESLPFGSVVDEAQLVPELLLAAKKLVDQDPAPGRFLLTGSSRLRNDSLGGSDVLAGRPVRPQLHPLTIGEKAGRPVSILSDLISGSADGWESDLTADEVLRHVSEGGMPGALGLSETGRVDRFGSYADRSLGAAMRLDGRGPISDTSFL